MKPSIPYIKQKFVHILNPPGQAQDRRSAPHAQWYINDHCFLVAGGLIHWFGITNPYPKDGNYYGPGTHRHIGHASAKTPFGPWVEHEDALMLPDDTTGNIGACFVARHGDGFVMLYGYNTGFHTAFSADLFAWVDDGTKRLISLGEGTRDPCVLALDGGGYLLYAAAGYNGFGAVALASSTNLVDWQMEAPALISDAPGNWGPLESPCVFFHDGRYYLMVNHSHHQYEETLVFTSANPHRFDWQSPLCTLFAHAAEVFRWDGKMYISHCGIEDQHWQDTQTPNGLWLAELGWAS